MLKMHPVCPSRTTYRKPRTFIITFEPSRIPSGTQPWKWTQGKAWATKTSSGPTKYSAMGGRRQRIDLGNDVNSKKQKVDDDDDEEVETHNPWTGLPYSQKYYSILKKRYTLPVYQFKQDLLKKVMANQCVVVEGETG